MHTLSLLAVVASTLLSIQAAPAKSCGNPPAKSAVTNGKAIYIISNAASNAVVAVPIDANGTLNAAAGTSTLTGGAGANAIDSSTNQSAGPDALFSQSAVKVSGNSVFAVNPGSNSVSMLSISPQDATKLTLVGQPVALPGEFPNTVAVSAKNKLACVGMTGAKAGVSCVSFDEATGCGQMDALRPFDLGQSTPPSGPLNTVSQVFFSEDEMTVFATVKGDPTVNNTGFLASYAVTAASAQGAASVSSSGDMSSPSGTAVLFGSFAIPGSTNLFVTDASFGAVVIGPGASSQNGAQAFTTVGKGVIAGQGATCWATLSPATNTAFVTDVETDRLVEMSLNNATILGQPIDLFADQDPGLTDIGAAGEFLYALSPGNGTTNGAVAVVSTSTRTEVQHADLSALGINQFSQGLTIQM